MRTITSIFFVASALFAVGCAAQDYRADIANDRAECVFKYRESLGAFMGNDGIFFTDGESVIDIPAARVGGTDSWVGMPSCDRKKWHCLIGVGAPLFMSKPFDKRVSSWNHGGYHYEFGKEFRLDLRGAIKVTPLLVYVGEKESVSSGNMDSLESVYFFDKEMNLIGYANEIPKLTEDSYSLDSAWLEGDRAALDCY